MKLKKGSLLESGFRIFLDRDATLDSLLDAKYFFLRSDEKKVFVHGFEKGNKRYVLAINTSSKTYTPSLKGKSLKGVRELNARGLRSKGLEAALAPHSAKIFAIY